MAAAMLVVAAVLVAAAAGVSVDPDLQEQPLRAEAEDVFVFPSMRLSSPLALVQINRLELQTKVRADFTITEKEKVPSHD